MINKTIVAFSLITPFLLFQVWLGDDSKFPILLFLFISIAICLLFVFVIGILRRSLYLILGLPLFVCSAILCFMIINLQSDINVKNAEVIIDKLEDYKVRNGSYPTSVSDLVPVYLSKLPKQWFLAYGQGYNYTYDPSSKSFSLTIKMGAKPTRRWVYGENTWDFID